MPAVTDEPTPRPTSASGRVTTRRWAALGLLTGLAVVALLIAVGTLPRQETVDGEEAVDQLAEAWRRYRTGTFVVESEWRRTKASADGSLVSATQLVQRPPDRIQRQFGSVRGQVNGEVVRCSSDPVEGYRCFSSDASAPDFAADVDAEVEAMRSYGRGERPLYAVTTAGDGCFELELVAAYPDPPYGRRATLCFDPESGALRYLRRELEGVVEEQQALGIRTDVRDADFDLTYDADYDPAGDLPEVDVDELVSGGPGTTR